MSGPLRVRRESTGRLRITNLTGHDLAEGYVQLSSGSRWKVGRIRFGEIVEVAPGEEHLGGHVLPMPPTESYVALRAAAPDGELPVAAGVRLRSTNTWFMLPLALE